MSFVSVSWRRPLVGGGLPAYPVYLTMVGVGALLRSLMYTLLSVYYVQTVGMNPLQLVLVGTTVELTVLLFEVPTGVVADTYSRRISVILGQILVGIAFLLEGTVPLFGAIVLAEVIRGVGETFNSGATDAWLADELGEERLGEVYLRASQLRRAASLAGIAGSAVLGSIWLPLPVLVGASLSIALGIFLLLFMPERGFAPAPRDGRTPWQAMAATLREGLQVARGRPLLLTFLAITAVFGLSSEGMDRLWEAHLLQTIGLPALGPFEPVAWISALSGVSALLGIAAAEVLRRRMDVNNHRQAARALLVLNALYVACVVVFALAGNLATAAAALLGARLVRGLTGPLFGAWLVQNVEPRVRATVLSMNGQADAVGQFTGGPAVGLVGTVWGLRAALAATGLLHLPAVFLFGRAGRQATAPVATRAD